MAKEVLIYDGECSYCRGFARLVRLLDRRKQISMAPFDASESQGLLRAQFGDNYGFSMYLFEAEEVSWGREAARRIIESVSLPRWMARLAFYVYPSCVRLMSKVTGRTRTVCGPDCAGRSSHLQKRQFLKIHESALQELQRVLKSVAI